jgi:HAD superfamily hydrolase (TIGR01509 family)
MSFLDGIEVACFDLFDTLIRVDVTRLPETEFDGNRIRSTIPILHEQIFAPRGVEIESLVAAVRDLWREVREELGSDEGSDDERYREMPAVEKYRRLLARLDGIDDDEIPGVAEEIADLHHQSLIAAAGPMEGAQTLLYKVRERGIPTVLVSNWDHARAGHDMLEKTGLSELLDHVVISEAVGIRKPHPRIFERALAPFDTKPDAALHVGDLARADAWGAGRLGFRTVWIDKASEGWPADLGPPPSVHIGRLEELLDQL